MDSLNNDLNSNLEKERKNKHLASELVVGKGVNEYMHAREELQSYFYRLVVLNEISRIIATGFEFETIIFSIIQAIKRLIEFDLASVALLNERCEDLKVFTLKPDICISEISHEFMIGKSQLSLMVMNNRKGIILHDLVDNKDPLSQKLAVEGIHSYLIVPLVSRNKVIGLFSIGSYQKGIYNKESLFLLQTIADQITPGVERYHLYREILNGQKRLRVQYENIPVPTYTWKKEGKNFILKDYNEAAKIFSNGEIINFEGKTAREFYQDLPEILEDMKRCFITRSTIKREISSRVWSKNKEKSLEITYNLMPDNLLIIHAQDITERKRAEDEMKERLLKFRLENGNIYLVEETSPILAFEAFQDLLKVNYNGFVFSRKPDEELKHIFKGNFEFFWLSEWDGKHSISPNIGEIENQIEKIPNKSAVLIDRLDYLIFKNNFKEILSFIQHLRDHAYITSLIIILSIDPSTLSKTEIKLLEKETKKIEPKFMINIPNTMFEILKYVYEQNNLGNKPSYTNIRLKMQITKPTVRKRIKGLLSFGYINEFISGNKKIIELSPKGWKLFIK